MKKWSYPVLFAPVPKQSCPLDLDSIAVSIFVDILVPEAKIQITLLIVRRGALYYWIVLTKGKHSN